MYPSTEIYTTNHRNVERRRSKAAKSVSDDTNGDITNGTDQSMMGATRVTLRNGRGRPSFARALKKSFRVFSKRSIFGESHACSQRVIQREPSIDFDVDTDEEDDFKENVVKTVSKKRVQASTEEKAGLEDCTVGTKDSSLAEGIPRVIYIVNGSFLSKVSKRIPLKRIQKSFRRVISNNRLIDEDDEEAYDKTLVEL